MGAIEELASAQAVSRCQALLPGWLSVPAAPPLASRDLAPAGAGRATGDLALLLVAAGGALDPPGDGFWTLPVGADPSCLAQRSAGRARLQLLVPPPWSGAWDAPSTWDKHQLDVLLSRGRQAVERAKLLGYGRLGLAGCLLHEPAAGASPLRPLSAADAYVRLRCAADPALAVASGALIAAAQMGVCVRLIGQAAGVAATLALALHPGIAPWLRPGRLVRDLRDGCGAGSALVDARAASSVASRTPD